MKISTTLKQGSFHDNYCEDFLISEQISSTQQVIAVMDGCTMGTEFAFASILTGKILRSIAKEFFYHDFIEGTQQSLNHKLKSILQLMI